jgi:hypothetical protein
MTKIIKMIPTGPENYLFIYGITTKNEVVFRSSMNIKHLRLELAHAQEGILYFGAFSIPLAIVGDISIVEIQT